jgi:hypothetical protein
MKTALTTSALIIFTLAGCGSAAENSASSAYMFAFEPCEHSSQFNTPTTVRWVTIGPLGDGTEMKIRAADEVLADGSHRLHTLTAQQVPPSGPETSNCWDRFPTGVPESFVNDNLTVPGTSGYWVGTYKQVRYVSMIGYGGAINNQNWNPSPWVRVVISTLNGGAWTAHQYALGAADPYHWSMDW